MVKIVTSFEDFERLRKRFSDLITPKRYVVVTDDFELFIFTPIRTSRHLHYYEFRVKPERYEEIRKMYEKLGFEVISGDVHFTT